MRIVVTGALGHIGSRLIREIPSAFPNTEIIMIDSLLTQRFCSLFDLPANGKYRFIKGDVLKSELSGLFKGADAIIHLAAITDAERSFDNRKYVEHVNYNATVKVAEACLQTDCPMIHISSTSVYGTQDEIVDEDCAIDDLRPQSPYAETKLKEERFLHYLGASKNLRFSIFRFGTICGVSPGMRFHTAINKFCWQAVMGEPLTVWRTAFHQKRPYLTLEDAIAAISFIIENNFFDKTIYNILTENLTVKNIIQFIEKYIKPIEIQYVDSKIMNQLSYEVSTDRIKNKGFIFNGKIKKSIAETIQLLKTAGVSLA